jgi:multidrug efflux pump subunit AcrA (membrane-fusion protein)
MSNTGKIFAGIAGALALMAAGATAMFLVMKGAGDRPATASLPAHPTPAVAAPAATLSDVTVTIAPDVLDRAGIQTMPATRGASSFGLRIPATVQPNAYRQVVVSSTSAGRVTAVAAELGGLVRQGDPLVTLHSPEVAEIERVAVSLYADLTLAGQQVARLEGLVGIGAGQPAGTGCRASAADTGLGRSRECPRATVAAGPHPGPGGCAHQSAAISPLVTLTAPITGTVTARAANPGQTLDSSVDLFTIVDLRTVWVVADVFERDIAAVRVGHAVTMTSAASPDAFSGRVTVCGSAGGGRDADGPRARRGAEPRSAASVGHARGHASQRAARGRHGSKVRRANP